MEIVTSLLVYEHKFFGFDLFNVLNDPKTVIIRFTKKKNLSLIFYCINSIDQTSKKP